MQIFYLTCCKMTAEKAAAFNVGKNKDMQTVKDFMGSGALLYAGGNTSVITSLVIHPKQAETQSCILAQTIQASLSKRPFVCKSSRPATRKRTMTPAESALPAA